MYGVTVFVSAYDKYAACWPILCHSLKKYWPDCPWSIRFVTNYLDSPCGERTIKVGDDKGWTHTTRKALEQIDTDVILFTIEDYWLTGPVDTKSLMEFADIVLEGRAVHLRVEPPGSTYGVGDFPGDSRLYVFAREAPYRAALGAALWRVDVLLSLLKDGETVWNYDWRSSCRSKDMEGFIGVKQPTYFPRIETQYYYKTKARNPEYPRGAVVKGKWTKSARKYVLHEGLDVDIPVGRYVWDSEVV